MDQKIKLKIDEFFKQFRNQSAKKGTILIDAGKNPPGVIYLTKGSIKQYVASKRGEELVVNIFKPISFFPMSWAINQTPNNFYFESLEEVDYSVAPREKVIEFINENPDVLYDLMARVFRGTDGLLTKMVQLMSGEAYTKVITELIINALRFGKQADTKIKLNLSEKDIASQTGLARETVSRVIQIVKNKDLVTMEKNTIVVNDIKKLEDELNMLT